MTAKNGGGILNPHQSQFDDDLLKPGTSANPQNMNGQASH